MNKINKSHGIYQIKNVTTEFCYTGQSINLKNRKRQHWNDLKNNRHENPHLQNSYNDRKKDFFVFEILMYCTLEDLTKYEQIFVDIDKSHGLSYNVRECVDSNKGTKFSDKACKNISIFHWDSSGKNNPMYGKTGKDAPWYGRKHTPEEILKMRRNNPNLIKKKIILKIIKMLNNNIDIKDISKILDISKNTVYRTKKGFYNDIYNL